MVRNGREDDQRLQPQTTSHKSLPPSPSHKSLPPSPSHKSLPPSHFPQPSATATSPAWLTPRIGAAAAVERWRGPLGARHDFEWSGQSTEVKASSATRGIVHRINGLDQLVPPEGGVLTFFSLRVREEADAGNTLPARISACRLALDGADDTIGLYESRLHQAGYSPAYEFDYETLKLRVVAEGLYRVDDNFPRIIPAAFAGEVPAGVELVEYEINLGGFEHLRIAARPSDPFPV